MPRATAYRLLNLLVQEEYLIRLGDLSGFALGRKVAELAHLVAPARPPQAVRSIVSSVRAHVRGGVHLAGYAGSTLRILDEDPDYGLSDAARLTRDLEMSAMGRLLLAELRRDAGATAGFVAETLARGFAVQTGAFDPARGCLAFPIRDSDGGLVAALSLCTASERVEHPGRLLDELRDGAERLGPLLA
jgi:DNA-binding IclR family transcriptional regulator